MIYKVYFDNRVITISPEPDRLQNYVLFHNYSDKEELYNQISDFATNNDIQSLNIYSPDIDSLWGTFLNWFTIAEAAGGLVKHTSGKYLFIQRYGKWDLPKGHVEPGESPEKCALREVNEECSITGHRIIKPLPSSYHTYLFEGKPYLKKTFWFSMEYTGSLVAKPQAEEGITAAQWLFPGEIATIKSNTWQSLLDLLNITLRV